MALVPTSPAATVGYDWTNGNSDLSPSTPLSPGWWLDRLCRRLIARQPEMARYASYYIGDHRLSFMAERLAFLLGPQFRDTRVNYCEVVVDKLIERLEVIGFRDGREAEPDTRLWGIWQANALDQEFAKGLRDGAVKGEFGLAVWPDARGEPQIRVQDPATVIVATDPEDRRVARAALKRWYDVDMGLWYATLYLPTQVWKFQAENAPAEPWQMQGAGNWTTAYGLPGLSVWDTWVPRVLPEGEQFVFRNPLGVVPIVPFPNKPDLNGIGVSELRNIVPLQDKVNKLNHDLLMASEFAAFPQKWATNVDFERDPDTGEVKSPWKVGVDRIFMAGPPESPGDAETKFGQFEPAELKNWTDALESALREIAVVSRMPPHYLLGQSGVFPSGESLRAAETGLVQKARDRWRDYAEPLEAVMRLAARIAGLDSLASATNLETLWRDPETRTESEHLNALTLMAGLGVPKKGLWARIPATPTEMEQWQKLLDEGDLPPVRARLTETAVLTPGATPPAAPPAESEQATAAPAPPVTVIRSFGRDQAGNPVITRRSA